MARKAVGFTAMNLEELSPGLVDQFVQISADAGPVPLSFKLRHFFSHFPTVHSNVNVNYQQQFDQGL